MSTGRNRLWSHGAERGKHEKGNETDDPDPFGLISLLSGPGDQRQRTELDDLANTPTGRFALLVPSRSFHRSQSVYSDTFSRNGMRRSNDMIKHGLERLSRQIDDTGERILTDTRCVIKKLRQDINQRFTCLELAIGGQKSNGMDEDNGCSTVETNFESRLAKIQRTCQQEKKDDIDSSETGAVGGIEHEVIDSVPVWKIDDEAWERCIKQKDKREAQRLIMERILLSQEMLNLVSVEFGRNSRIFKNICTEISLYIKAQSKEIVNVYAAYRTVHDTSNEESAIVFAVITASKKTQNIMAFNYDVEQICVDEVNNSQENHDIQRRENSIPYPEETVNRAVRQMKRHSQGLMQRHSNITRISVSWIKSTRYGLADAEIKDQVCIAIYVSKKGLIPIDEKPLPKILNGFTVDVREGICLPFLGSHELHENVKMGCAISGQSVAGQSYKGTIGGFIESGNNIYCITSAHVFAQNPNLENLRSDGTWTAMLEEPSNFVYQPSQPSEPFGTLVRAVFTEGGGGIAGVDAAIIRVQKRFPNSGIFPDAANDREAGFGDENPMNFNSGKISKSVNRTALVVKHGSTSGITKGSFRIRGGAVRTTTAHNWGFVLFNQYEIESFNNTEFAQAGDSGAMVFTVEGDELLGIGIVACGIGNTCLVTPICDVLNALEIPRPFKMKEFMQGNTNTSIPVGCCTATAATKDKIQKSESVQSLDERFDYMEQALSQDVARQANAIKDEVNLNVGQQISNLKTEINDKIERSVTGLEEKINNMQTENRKQMHEMKESVEKMFHDILSHFNAKK